MLSSDGGVLALREIERRLVVADRLVHASSIPAHQCRFSLRFVDIHLQTLNIDPDLVEKAITPRTWAILIADLLGNPGQFDALYDIARRKIS